MGLKQVALDFLGNLFSFDQAHPLLFTQFYFWAFFAIVLAFLCVFRSKILLRNAFIFFASLFFYYKTSGLFLILLGFVIVYNYFAGLLLPHCGRSAWRKTIVVLSVVVDLSLLCYYKYAYFLTDVVNNLFGTSFIVKDWFAAAGNAIAGSQAFSVDSIFLPVGTHSLVRLFPPGICRLLRLHRHRHRSGHAYGVLSQFLPPACGRSHSQGERIHSPTEETILPRQDPVRLCCVLDSERTCQETDPQRLPCSELLRQGFREPDVLTALFGYSLQVYADFSGYTDIATGVAMLMGFYLPKNFNSPYKAKNATEFWRRWHISLSTWLRDYLYIPLGGNRNGTFGSYAIILGIAFLASALAGSWWVFFSVLAMTFVIALLIIFKKGWRKELISDINRMDTMLLGGLWHGASWNFMIWGGLNGLGILIYRFWHGCNSYFKVLVIGLVVSVFGALRYFFGTPVFNLFFWWTLIILAGAFVGMVFHFFRNTGSCNSEGSAIKWIRDSWAVLMTIIFITFTRLFFRSGSNLDPAEANEKAWSTAKNMVNQIGGQWDWSLVPQMAWQHRSIILVFVIGMLIHWLPDDFKRRYRIWFARMPLFLMVLACVAAIFVICQFVTADLQSFIYFQF